MIQPLLQTKLTAPLTRADRIERPSIRSMLDRVFSVPLTVIVAPAGFGKTTAITDWIDGLDSTEVSCAWLSLEPDDSDPERMFRYTLASVDKACPGLVDKTMALVNASEWPDHESRFVSFVNDLTGLDGKLVIVLDDFHALDGERMRQSFGSLAERLPSQVHIVITSRHEPDIALHRLRARGLLLEISQDDLRFSPQEVKSFLNDSERLSIDGGAADALHERTEGWAAGVQLAAISMRTGRSVDEVLREFTGENRYLFSYFAEETLRGLPESTREFLTQTSVLERMNGPLCDLVTDRSDSSLILEDLAQRNLFVVRLDEQNHWYRYHHLFSEFLRSQAENEFSDLLPEIHLKVSEWYESEGLIEQAVSSAIAGEHFDRARRLSDSVADELMAQGRMAQVISWSMRMPDEVVRESPSLLMTIAWQQMLKGDMRSTKKFVGEVNSILRSRVDGDPSQSKDPSVLLQYATCRGIEGYIQVEQGNGAEGLPLIQEARRLMPENASFAGSFLAVGEGIAHWVNNDLDRSRQLLQSVIKQTSSPFIHVISLNCLAHTYIFEARVSVARTLAEQAIDYVTERGVPNMPITAMTHNLLAMIAWQQNRNEDAERHIKRARAVAPGTESEGTLAWAAATELGVRQSRRDFDGAMRSAKEIMSFARDTENESAIERAVALYVKVLIASGRVEEAVLEANAGLRSVTDIYESGASFTFAYSETLKAWARLFLSTDRIEEAGQIGAQLYDLSSGTSSLAETLDARVITSLANYQQGDVDRAVDDAVEALLIGQDGLFVRAFADEGEVMAELLKEVKARPASPDWPDLAYVDVLIKASLGHEESPEMVSTVTVNGNGSGFLVDTLTRREQEILGMIAAGSSNNDIAGELFVTSGTVKTHINNLFRKLDVRSRTQAVARARELQIL